MKNFLIALGLLMVIMFVKNLYEDKESLEFDMEVMKQELGQKEQSLLQLQKENKELIVKLQKEKNKIRKPKKEKRIIKSLVEQPIVEPQETIIKEIKDTLVNL